MAEAVRHEPMQTISIIITPCHGRHAVSFDREYLFTNNPYRPLFCSPLPIPYM